MNDKRPCFIYAITHLASGRRYVGSCLNPVERWITHRSQLKHQKHHCSHLQKAWNCYGQDAFAFSVLQKLKINDRALRAKAELTAIAKHECFNSRIANLGLTNFVNNEETRAKINSGIAKRLASDPKLRKFLKERGRALAAHARTPEMRKRRSITTKHLWKDKTHRENISKKLAVYWQTPGIKDAHSERVKKHRSTPKARKHNSKMIKAAWADPNSGFHNRKLTRWADQQTREIQAAKMRAIWAKRKAAST